MKSLSVIAAALSFGSTAYAQYLVTSCPETNLCYSLNIPESTASSGNGDIYFQISAPTTYQWVALGQGSGMAGSNIFVIYTSANGQNVTLSPRLGKGHVEPQHDTAAQVTLLDGSGVSNNVMTANVRCSNCQSWSGGTMDFTASTANWIYGHKSGSSLNTDDVAADISQHDDAEPFEWVLAEAKGGDSVNPFVSSASTTASPSGSPSGSPSQPTGTSRPRPTDSGSTTLSYSNAPFGGDYAMGDRIITAHGTIAGIAFVTLFPTGGILIRLANFTGLVWVHAAIQLIAYGFYIVAFAMGIYLATQLNLFDNHHPIIGIVLFVALTIQPLTGFLHHRFFGKYGRRTGWSYEHLGIGRIAIIIGIINGGNGLRLANASNSALIAYGVCAAVMAITYIVSIIIGERRRRRSGQQTPEAHRLESRGGESPVQLRETFGNKE